MSVRPDVLHDTTFAVDLSATGSSSPLVGIVTRQSFGAPGEDNVPEF